MSLIQYDATRQRWSTTESAVFDRGVDKLQTRHSDLPDSLPLARGMQFKRICGESEKITKQTKQQQNKTKQTKTGIWDMCVDRVSYERERESFIT